VSIQLSLNWKESWSPVTAGAFAARSSAQSEAAWLKNAPTKANELPEVKLAIAGRKVGTEAKTHAGDERPDQNAAKNTAFAFTVSS
jgi:hypothetical protein